MSRDSLAHHGFLPDSPEARYELLLRSMALMLSTALFNAIEIGIAVHDEKPGSILNNGIGTGISAFAALGLMVSAWRNREMAGSTPCMAKISAMGSAFSAMLVFSAVCASLTSMGNNRFTDGAAEGGVAVFALLSALGFALLQKFNVTARTQTSILDVVTCKEAPDQRAMVAGSLLGNIPPFATFAYFDFRRQRFGSFTGCAISVLTNTGLFAQTLRNASADPESAFSYKKFMVHVAGVAGFLFLCGGVTNRMNGRSAIESGSELFLGAGLLFMVALYKACDCLYARYNNTQVHQAALLEEGRAPLLSTSL
ncbi:MAG: hypothetical protein Q8L78_02750 [Coxiellaceae bacterium]|nr:hypothetical protein [Coxiellaceae bacterium]